MRALVAILGAVLFLLGPGPTVAAAAAATEGSDSAGATVPAAEQAGETEVMSEEDKADAEIGRSAAAELEKQYKVLEDSTDRARIKAIVEKIRPVTQKPKQQYEVKVIESKAINAFSLPGGYLYFTQGLLDAVESEDELAAVAAHEMAHICRNHSRRLMARNERYSSVLGAGVVAAILTKSESIDPGAIAMVGGLVVQDALNHYGRESELEADREGVLYLQASKVYHPVAMLTVAEGLARLEGGGPPVELGVNQTHPFAADRAKALIAQLGELNIPIERRRVTKSLVATAAVVREGDREIGEVRLNEHVIFRPAAEVDGESGTVRARRSAEVLNRLLFADLQPIEVLLTPEGDRRLIRARGETLVRITPEDATYHETTVAALAQAAMAAIRLSFQEEKVRRAYR